jgi:pimeloyl-ACP methyl ester carboxylesterase
LFVQEWFGSSVTLGQTEAMTAPSSLSIHGHEVAYRMAGDADDAILLIHGMAGSSETWRHVMPALAKDHVVIAPDLPGHGASSKHAGDYSLGAYANTLRDLLLGLGVERVTVVGQSLGGGVAMQLAYQHPELCERLVLVSSGGLGREVSPMLRLLSAPGAELVLKVAVPWFVRDGGNAVRHWLGAKGVHAYRIDEMWRAYDSLGDADTRSAFLRTLRSVIDPGGQSVCAEDRLYLTDALPTMIIWGDHDPIIPVTHAERAREAMPHSRVEILPGVGHFPQVEASAKVIELLSDFVATTAPAAIDATMFRERLLHTA